MRHLLALALTVFFAAGLRAADQPVEITPELQGAWCKPDGAWDGRAVLLLHGMGSDRDDAGGLFRRLAETLAGHGIASLRINFRGEGDAKRTNLESTRTTRRDDARAARAFVLSHGAKADRLGAVGWSLGAVTGLDLGAGEPAAFRSLCVWSGPSGDFGAQLQHDFADAYRATRSQPVGNAEFVGWKKITLRADFFDGYAGLDCDALLANFPGAFLSIRGSEDYLPHADDAWMRIAGRRSGRVAEAVLLAGADHTLNVFVPGAPQPARVLELTVAWFERTL